ncbi:transmembrane protein 138 [Diabrotica undecimpunctata]|uniref:transmembrane protein 138 n=1 Tax=Diabrotica undecimpunctata TaxID=50387 RepID=UPI003B640654
MKLNTTRYTVILTIQTILILFDWCINIFSMFNRGSNAKMLVMFIAQDACLILALSILLLTFFSTYVFQTGLVYLLYERFRATLLVCMIYFILTTVVNVWLLIQRWSNTRQSWNSIFLLIFMGQRFMSAIYYYYYKRAALRISDPRFYEDMDLEEKSINSVHN